MKTTSNCENWKRPVNLTLSQDLVVQVRGLTNNPSGVVDPLLIDYVEHELKQRVAKANTKYGECDRFRLECLQRQPWIVRGRVFIPTLRI